MKSVICKETGVSLLAMGNINIYKAPYNKFRMQ